MATNPALCEQELQTTQSYLLRRGWRADDKYTLRTHGVSAATTFARTHALPHEVMDHHTPPWDSLIRHILQGGALHCRLTPHRLRQRQQLLRLNTLLDKSLRAGVAVAMLMLLINAGLQAYWMNRNADLRAQLAAMPAASTDYLATRDIADFWLSNSTDVLSYVGPLASVLPPAAYLSNLDWTATPGQPALDVVIENIPQPQQAALVIYIATATQAWAHQQADGASQNGALGTSMAANTPLRLHIGQKAMP